MVPYKIRKWISHPNHINIIVHHTISKLQNLQQMSWPPGCKVEETLDSKKEKKKKRNKHRSEKLSATNK